MIQSTGRKCFSSIHHNEPKKGTNSIRKYLFRLAYTSLGVGVICDGLNDFQTIGGVNRFMRSLTIAVKNSFEYSYHLYGLSEESEGYDEVRP